VSPVRIIPIKIPHVVVELPKTGVMILLPVISSAITIAPDENAIDARKNIFFVSLCFCVDIYLELRRFVLNIDYKLSGSKTVLKQTQI